MSGIANFVRILFFGFGNDDPIINTTTNMNSVSIKSDDGQGRKSDGRLPLKFIWKCPVQSAELVGWWRIF